jgi:hypothetical protein
MPIQITLSAELFGGYRMTFPNELSNLSLEDQTIVVREDFKRDLKELFHSKNLFWLVEKVNALTIHLHAPLVPDTHAYACDHCHTLHTPPRININQRENQEGV